MEKNIFRYIWRHTRLQQVWILSIVLLSMPTYFLALELPKRIVNGPIQGQGFEDGAASTQFLRFELGLPDWLSEAEPLLVFSGFELDRLELLFALSIAFLALVCINGLFKFYINTYKGRLGERMLRRLRYELMDRVLRFPMNQFKRVKPSEVATMIKDEVEPMGGFIGDAYVAPLFLGGQAITAMIFILVQNVWLGLIAGGIVAVQALLIPRLRRRLIELGRERQLTTRALAGRVGEVVDGISSVHVNDTSNYERAELSAKLGRIFAIRYEIYQRKYFVKFLNNFLAQLTPFLFYSIGGYFALTGRLDIGQLVAVIAAYKDLPSPIKELIDWDQERLDVQVKYAQVIEQFDVDEIIDEKLQPVETTPGQRLAGAFKLSGVSAFDDAGTKLLERLSLELPLGSRVALVGGMNSGADYLCEALARLLPLTSGRISIAGQDLHDLPETVTGRRIGYVSADAPLYQGSVRENILYVLKRAPLREPDYEGDGARLRDWHLSEAKQSGNTSLDVRADWIDYEAAGATGPQDLIHAIRRVLKLVDLDQDMLQLGLRGRIDPTDRPELAERILQARAHMQEALQQDEYSGLVEPFHPERYNPEATVGENLMFGTPLGDELSQERIADHPYIRKVLKEQKLEGALFDMGREIAGTAIELFADLPPDLPFFEQLSFMPAESIPDYQAVLSRVQNQPMETVSDSDIDMILKLPFLYIEPRHRLGLLDQEMMERIVAARKAFRDGLPDDLNKVIEFYDPGTLNRAASVQDNILAGRIAYGIAGANEKVLALVHKVLEENALIDEVLEIGLEFNVGTGGKRLSESQRQKVLLARALLKRPDVLILNRALAALDKASQGAIIERVLDLSKRDDGEGFGIVWALANAGMAKGFDKVIVMEDGSVAEQGEPDDLLRQDGRFSKLVA